MTGGALLVAGTSSDAGKSLVTVGICRWLRRQGLRVAPFKAQNMSNNSIVISDDDRHDGHGGYGEIGRAQWLQALAAGATPEPAMNPVLLKPGSDHTSHVVVMGQPRGTLRAGEFATGRAKLAEAAFAALDDLRSRFDVVVCEGAGSPAEINLRAGDYVNMGLARHARMPVVVVGDIDRGGMLAAMVGTLALLDDDANLVAGWIVNKFRGDLDLLKPGLVTLTERTGRPVLGVLPWLDDVWTDSEDSLSVAGWERAHRRATAPGALLRVAVVRLPRVSNATDVDALASEPGVTVTVTADADTVAAADLVVIPGSRATVADLGWLRGQGIADVIAARAAAGRPVLGICGGYQMLAEAVDDEVESDSGRVDGLGLLPVSVKFSRSKVLGLPRATWRGHDVSAYEIHHGVAVRDDSGAPGVDVEPFLDGWRAGAVWGTTWHGAFENDDFRREWLAEVAAQAGVGWRPVLSGVGFNAYRESMVERLAEAVDKHLDTEALLGLVRSGEL